MNFRFLALKKAGFICFYGNEINSTLEELKTFYNVLGSFLKRAKQYEKTTIKFFENFDEYSKFCKEMLDKDDFIKENN